MTELNLLEQIDEATHLGTFPSNSPEWHALRSKGVGGSLVGTIAGLNKWESPYTAWCKFTGKIPNETTDSPAMEWGRRLESVVMDKFQDEHPELEIMREVGTWQNLERPYQIANPDGVAMDEHGNLAVIEIKTARFPDDWDQGVPLYYLTQVQWYLSCLGIQRAYVVVLIGGSDYREYEIEADHFQQMADIALVEQFLDAVEQDKAPAWDGSESTYESVRKLHPDIQDHEVELGDLGALCLEAIQKQNDATTEALKLKSQVLDSMGLAKRGLVNGQWIFSRTARGSGTPFLSVKRGQ